MIRRTATLPADHVPMLQSSERMLDEFPLHVMPHKQDDLGAHTHSFMELVYIKRGFGSHIHADQEYPIHRGDCFVILPGDPHGYRDVKDLSIVNVLFYPRIIEHHMPILREVSGFVQMFSMEPALRTQTAFKHKLHLKADQTEIVDALLTEMAMEEKQKAAGYQVVCTGLFLKLIVFLSRCFEQNTEARGLNSPDMSGEERVAKVLSYIESQFDKELTLNGIASEVCMSASHLSHVFKESTGLSLFDYLLRFRIDKARYLLGKTGLNVTEVAFSAGFNDPAYFSRAFKKLTGTTPKEFRKLAAPVD